MHALEIENLSKTYKNGVEALNDVSLIVEQGDFFALLGPNGAGKSTAIGIVSSLVRKTSGRVRIFGTDIDVDFSTAKKQLGIVPQEFNFNVFYKVIDILTTQAGYYGIPYRKAKKQAEKYLDLLGLSNKKNEMARHLSGGMKRRLMIARSMLHEPRMLILDEPTAGVDIEIRRTMWGFLRELNTNGTTIILTTHYLEEAENLCRNIAIINHGTIIENSTLPNLLKKLDCERFILYIDMHCEEAPSVPPYNIVLIDPTTLDVEISKTGSVSDLLAKLTQQGIVVKSMRNKTNRLEELFLRMTKEDIV
ncbi:MAG: ABC transporter [Coxiella sp. (in: Bacteria)]|nr:MAG: ABC transporter [Coxiella sp. (in: g-proteobacteria)]